MCEAFSLKGQVLLHLCVLPTVGINDAEDRKKINGHKLLICCGLKYHVTVQNCLEGPNSKILVRVAGSKLDLQCMLGSGEFDLCHSFFSLVLWEKIYRCIQGPERTMGFQFCFLQMILSCSSRDLWHVLG